MFQQILSVFCLLNLTYNVRFLYSYGDPDLQYYGEEFEQNFIENHRVKRSAGGGTTQAYGYNSSGIYVITGYFNPGATTIPSIPITMSYPYNGTIIITAYNLTNFTTTTTTTSTSTTTTPMPSCPGDTHIYSPNGTCIARSTILNSTISILLNNTANDTDKGNALTEYIVAVTNYTATPNASRPLNLSLIDGIFSNLNISNFTSSSDESVMYVTRPTDCTNQTIIGALFRQNRSSGIIDSENKDAIVDTPSLTAAGYIDFMKVCSNVSRFNILIFNNPTIYRNVSNATDQKLTSALIMAKVNYVESSTISVSIQLYFHDNVNAQPYPENQYICGYFDDKTNQWNSLGCSAPKYDQSLNRFQCECNHFSSFGLIWQSRETPDPDPVSLKAEDIASIALQAFSIACILGTATYAFVIWKKSNPTDMLKPKHMLPLLSYIFIMILFIFYITLSLCVYTRFKSEETNNQTLSQLTTNGGTSNERPRAQFLQNKLNSRVNTDSPNTTSYLPCSQTEKNLAFTVYFLIIFMLCIKTSIGIDNYRRYVQLCPPPTFRLLLVLLVSSIIFSGCFLTGSLVANSNTENGIMQANSKKICWFTNEYILKLLVPPIGFLLAVNIFLVIWVIIRNVRHANEKHKQHKTEEHKIFCDHRKTCVRILIGSTITQGFGWIFGIIIALATVTENQTVATVFAWFFIISNGLEGIFAIILYYLISKKRILLDKFDIKDGVPIEDEGDGGHFMNIEDTRDNVELRENRLDRVASDSPRNSLSEFRDSKLSHRIYRVNTDS